MISHTSWTLCRRIPSCNYRGWVTCPWRCCNRCAISCFYFDIWLFLIPANSSAEHSRNSSSRRGECNPFWGAESSSYSGRTWRTCTCRMGCKRNPGSRTSFRCRLREERCTGIFGTRVVVPRVAVGRIGVLAGEIGIIGGMHPSLIKLFSINCYYRTRIT